MTDRERIALAKYWYGLPLGAEWTQVAIVFAQLKTEGVIPSDMGPMDLCLYVAWESKHFDLFDALVQRVLETKLLGVAK